MQRERKTQPLTTYLSANIRDDTLLEAELLILAFATGMQDATTFPDYHCFASNQTGNTVLLAVGAAGIGGTLFDLQNIGVSLGSFVAGVLVMGQLGNHVGCRRRLWLLVSNTLQTTMVFTAIGLQYRNGVSVTGSMTMGVIALLGFSSGAQVAMARSLKITEITTAMATAAWVDVLVDFNILESHNRPRNRRLLFLLSLFAGSFAGAFAYSKVGSAFALLISGVGKVLVTIVFSFNKGMEEDTQDVEKSASPLQSRTLAS